MKPLKFRNPRLQKLADRLSGRREIITIIVLLAVVVLLWWVERQM